MFEGARALAEIAGKSPCFSPLHAAGFPLYFVLTTREPSMDATWRWGDIAPARAGGRPLPTHVRLLLLTSALSAGILLGDLVRYLAG